MRGSFTNKSLLYCVSTVFCFLNVNMNANILWDFWFVWKDGGWLPFEKLQILVWVIFWMRGKHNCIRARKRLHRPPVGVPFIIVNWASFSWRRCIIALSWPNSYGGLRVQIIRMCSISSLNCLSFLQIMLEMIEFVVG